MPIHIRQGAYLPHWTADGATYAVTFRLAGSLPVAVLEQILAQRANLQARIQQADRSPTSQEQTLLARHHSINIERFLDSGAGSCCLRGPRAAAIVAGALRHFESQRYDLAAWCVMPNHVHAVVRPLNGHTLAAILHSWKSFSAQKINELLHRTSPHLWQRESYDHLIRDAEDFSRAVAYVLDNPAKAGLLNWEWVGTGEWLANDQ